MSNSENFVKVFRDLSLDEQEILMLRYIDGQSLRNLAVILELPSLKFARDLIRELEVKILSKMAESN